MRKKGIRAAVTALVLLLCISLAGALGHYSSGRQAEDPVPATTVEQTAAGENAGTDGEAQSDERIIIDEDAVPLGSGADSSVEGMPDGVAFGVLGVVAGVMGVAAVAAIAAVIISKRKNE